MPWAVMVYNGRSLEVIRKDGRTPTMRDLKLRQQWQDYLYTVAERKRNPNHQ